MKKKLTREEDAKLLKNRIKKLLGTYQYIDPDFPHESEYMMRDKSVEENKLAWSMLYAIILIFALMVAAFIVGSWLWGKINS